MPRKRSIAPDEARIWLGVLLDAAFDPTARHQLNLGRSAEILNQCAQEQGHTSALKLRGRDGSAQLLSLASDLTNYPEDYTSQREAELLLAWCEMWLQPDDWRRLVERVKKRRQRRSQE